MDIQIILNVMAELFIIIVIGFILFKVGVFDKGFNQKLTKLILHVSMPALIVSAVLNLKERPSGNNIKTIFIIAVGFYLVMPIIGLIVAKLIKADNKKQGLFAFMMTYSNIGFIGFPVVSVICGSLGVFYTAIVNIVFNVTSFTIGVLLLRTGGGANGKISLAKIFSPGMFFSVLALFIYFFNWHFPVVVEEAVEKLGNTTTPLAMLLMGATLASMPLKQIFNDGRVYIFSLIKQIIIPIIIYPTVKYFVKDSVLFNVLMLLLLMPAATNAIMFSIEYNGDEKLAAKTVFLSTIMSLVTIPLIIVFLKIA